MPCFLIEQDAWICLVSRLSQMPAMFGRYGMTTMMILTHVFDFSGHVLVRLPDLPLDTITLSTRYGIVDDNGIDPYL
jgi:hypothetical protein